MKLLIIGMVTGLSDNWYGHRLILSLKVLITCFHIHPHDLPTMGLRGILLDPSQPLVLFCNALLRP